MLERYKRRNAAAPGSSSFSDLEEGSSVSVAANATQVVSRLDKYTLKLDANYEIAS
jgi:hypothetical protein